VLEVTQDCVAQCSLVGLLVGLPAMSVYVLCVLQVTVHCLLLHTPPLLFLRATPPPWDNKSKRRVYLVASQFRNLLWLLPCRGAFFTR